VGRPSEKFDPSERACSSSRRSARRRGAAADHLDGGLYLEGFRHTIALLQTRDAIERVAAECAEDLTADNVVYAEVRCAPELSTEGGLTLDEVATGAGAGPEESNEATRIRHAASGPLSGGRAARGVPP
jgi:adenosine deaminase